MNKLLGFGNTSAKLGSQIGLRVINFCDRHGKWIKGTTLPSIPSEISDFFTKNIPREAAKVWSTLTPVLSSVLEHLKSAPLLSVGVKIAKFAVIAKDFMIFAYKSLLILIQAHPVAAVIIVAYIGIFGKANHFKSELAKINKELTERDAIHKVAAQIAQEQLSGKK